MSKSYWGRETLPECSLRDCEAPAVIETVSWFNGKRLHLFVCQECFEKGMAKVAAKEVSIVIGELV